MGDGGADGNLTSGRDWASLDYPETSKTCEWLLKVAEQTANEES